MLSLNRPPCVFEGVTFFADHDDARQWYYLPRQPRLERAADGSPAFQLLKYRGIRSGGFLNLDVSLRIEAERLSQAVGQLQKAVGLSALRDVQPAPMFDGRVSMVMLGSEGGGSGGARRTGAKLSEVCAPVHPALYGDHRATFSVALAQEGVDIVQAALAPDGFSPVSVLYTLEYLALRPAFEIRYEGDWKSVHQTLQDSFRLDLVFTRIEVDKVIQQLIDHKDIRITALGQSDDAAYHRAVEFVREDVTAAFFRPSVGPATAAERAEAGVVRLESDSWLRLQTIDYTAIDLRSLTLSMRQQAVVRRWIAPQSQLSDLFGAQDAGKIVVAVTLGSPYFSTRSIEVASVADFAADFIDFIVVTVQYGDSRQSVRLGSNDPSGASPGALHRLKWPCELAGGVATRSASYQYDIYFKDREDRPRVLHSAPATTDADIVLIDPDRDGVYTVKPVRVVGLGIDWNRYARVDVRLRREPEVCEGVVTLEADRREATWRLFAACLSHRRYEYQAVFGAKGSDPDLALPWIEGDSFVVDLRNPQERLLSVDSSLFETGFVRIAVEVMDAAEPRTYDFDAGGPFEKSIPVVAGDAGRQVVGWVATFFCSDGTPQRHLPRQSRDMALCVAPNPAGHAVICVRAHPGNGAAAGRAGTVVELRHRASGTAKTYEPASLPDGCQYFEFDYYQPQDDAYQYRVVRMDRSDGEWTSARGNLTLERL